MQEFQQRANRIRQLATDSRGRRDAASAIAEDVGFLRTVANALAGEDSELDVRR